MTAEVRFRAKWYHFIPILGYFLYLPQSSIDFPDLVGRTKLLMIMENTMLYVSLGAASYLLGISRSHWLIIVSIVVVIATPFEFLLIRKWGKRFKILGWHRVQPFVGRKLLMAILFVGIHTWSFLCLGHIASEDLAQLFLLSARA